MFRRYRSQRLILAMTAASWLLSCGGHEPTSPSPPDTSGPSFPTYVVSLPRPAYPEQPDEAVVTNGEISAALAPDGDDGYRLNELRRVLAPPYLLNNSDAPTLRCWGYDDAGPHEVANERYDLAFNLEGLAGHVDDIRFGDAVNTTWAVDVAYHALPGKRVIVVTYAYENVSETENHLKVACSLRNPQVDRSDLWYWLNPPFLLPVDARYDAATGRGAIETTNAKKTAACVFGFDGAPSSWAVTTDDESGAWQSGGSFSGAASVSNVGDHNQYLAYDVGAVAPGQKVSVSAVLALAGSIEEARSDFTDTVQNLATRLSEARQTWDARWKATRFEVRTPDPDLDRMSDLAMSLGILAWDDLNDSWVTTFSRRGRGVNYLWDAAYAGYGLLWSDPPRVKATLRSFLDLDWRSSYAYRLHDKAAVGVYYAYNHESLTRLVYRYVALTGDAGFLNERVASGQTVIEVLDDTIDYVHSTLDYDFGGNQNLLEVVPHYTGEVPGLVASTFWMAGKIEALALLAGREDIAGAMDTIADAAADRLQGLWDPDARWFRTGEGNLSYGTQVFGVIWSGAATRQQIDGLLARRDDFVFPFGTRSLAAYDVDYSDQSPRGDWDGPASYVGCAGDLLQAFSCAGMRDDLLDLARGISRWWAWRFFQPQGIEAATGKAMGPIASDGTNTSAARYCSVVAMDLLGLEYALGGVDVHDAYPPGWDNAAGTVSFRDVPYSARIAVPCRAFATTFYVDKPAAGPDVYAYASVYDASGEWLYDWYSQRLPKPDRDLVYVLHFGPSHPNLTDLDELTEVIDATAPNRYALRNTTGSGIELRVIRSGDGRVVFDVTARAGRRYVVTVNGERRGDALTADADGRFTFSYAMTGDEDVVRFDE